jgi:hypothetical protein
MIGLRSITPSFRILEHVSVAPIIRPLARTDSPQWLPLWEGYNTFYGRSGETALPDAITQMTWARFFDAQEPLAGTRSLRIANGAAGAIREPMRRRPEPASAAPAGSSDRRRRAGSRR